MSRLRDINFNDLVDDMTRHVHTSLIEGGGKGLRQGMWLAMQTAIQWKDAQILAEKEEKAKAKKK